MSASVPKIEASVSLSGQTSAIAQTSLLTPPSNGMYRVSINALVTAGTGSVTPNIYFDDDGGSEGLSGVAAGAGSGPSGEVLTFRANSSAPIKYSTSISGSPTYRLDVVVESL